MRIKRKKELAMTYEEAISMKILLISGFYEPYISWLDQKIISEDPLSRITVDLLDCGEDINKIISCLYQYCFEHSFDQNIVCENLRLFIKDQFESGKMSKAACVDTLDRFARNSECEHESVHWANMVMLSYYHDYAEEDLVSMEAFDTVFMQYLQDGTLPVPFSGNPHPIKKSEHETAIRKPTKQNFFRRFFAKK